MPFGHLKLAVVDGEQGTQISKQMIEKTLKAGWHHYSSGFFLWRHVLRAKVTVDEIDKPPRMPAKISEMGS
jgi:hypothetical protein